MTGEKKPEDFITRNYSLYIMCQTRGLQAKCGTPGHFCVVLGSLKKASFFFFFFYYRKQSTIFETSIAETFYYVVVTSV